jgi:threonine aldolase
MIVGRMNHTVRYEVANVAAYGGVQTMTLDVQPDGTLDLDQIRNTIRPGGDIHYPVTRLICLENTHGSSGSPLTAEYTHAVGEIAHSHGAKLHVDGARIFNAAAALDTPVSELAADADTVTFCLSKGLCAPVGSVIVGSAETIERARKIRKSLGGGMRQGGVLAAAGLIALREMTRRLKEDHANARALAEGIATIPYLKVDLARVRTNMVFFDVAPGAPFEPEALLEALAEQYQIRMNIYGGRPRAIRAVTHYYISRDQVKRAVEALRALLTVPARVSA